MNSAVSCPGVKKMNYISVGTALVTVALTKGKGDRNIFCFCFWPSVLWVLR